MTADAEPRDGRTTLVVTGAGGRMGREVIEAAADREGLAVVGAVNRSPVGDAAAEVAPDGDDTTGDPGLDGSTDEYGTVGGVTVRPSGDLPALLADHQPAAVVDFTAPASTVEYASHCAAAGVALVTGTTGLDDDDRAALRGVSEGTPVLWASNFSRGIAALRRAVRAAVDAVPGYAVEVTETHHDGKRDAPSGTATTLIEDVEAARPDLTERRHGRVGEAPRRDDEIGVHARRAGDVTGEHEVLLAGDDNVLSLSHRAGSRRVFAAGALDAATWLADRDPGWYEFDDVLDAGATDDAPDDGHTTEEGDSA